MLGAALLAAMAILARANVITRYLIELPLAFTEELEVNAMVWLTLLGAATAFRKRKHLRLLFFIQKLRPATRVILERSINILAAALFCYLGYLGWLQILDDASLHAFGHGGTDPWMRLRALHPHTVAIAILGGFRDLDVDLWGRAAD